jgi:hypothetical protein
MLERGQRAAPDPRASLQTLGRNARESSTTHPVARRLPGLACHPQHPALAGPGIAHHQGQAARTRDVRHRLSLLRAQPGRGHGTAGKRLIDAMRAPCPEPCRMLPQPPFRRPHRGASEPLLPSPVHTKPHEKMRGLDPRHHPRELLRPVAVRRHQPRQVAPREAGAVLGQELQRDARIGRQALAVPRRQGPVRGRALLRQAPSPLPPARRPDLALRLKPDPPLLVAAVVHPLLMPMLRQSQIDPHRQRFPPVVQKVGAVPGALLRPEPGLAHTPHRQQHMRMRPRQAVRTCGLVHVEIGDHPAGHELLLHVGPHQRDIVGIRELARQRQLDLARQLRVLAPLVPPDLVPQVLAIGEPVRCPRRQEHRRVDHPRLARALLAPARTRSDAPQRGSSAP